MESAEACSPLPGCNHPAPRATAAPSSFEREGTAGETEAERPIPGHTEALSKTPDRLSAVSGDHELPSHESRGNPSALVATPLNRYFLSGRQDTTTSCVRFGGYSANWRAVHIS